MGKVHADNMVLENLIKQNKPDKSKLSIDKPDKEFLKPFEAHKEEIERSRANEKEYCGVMIPEEIYNICKSLEAALQSQGKYTQALDFQIFNTAVQLFTYNKLVKNLVYQDHYVATRELTTTSESYRRALQYVGLTIDAKKGALDAKDAVENNPLANFLNSMEDDAGEKKTIKKKKKEEV